MLSCLKEGYGCHKILALRNEKMDTFFCHIYSDCELREHFTTKLKTQLVCNLSLHFVCPSRAQGNCRLSNLHKREWVCLHRGICCFPESRGVLTACLAGGPGGEVHYLLEGFAMQLIVLLACSLREMFCGICLCMAVAIAIVWTCPQALKACITLE